MDKYRNEATTAGQTAESDLAPAKAVNVFADLCTLLEEYGPAWYSEEIHNRCTTGTAPASGGSRNKKDHCGQIS
jgi:hypothetical protein